MKLTFLGTGTSTGVPAMRCRCRVCTSTDPRDKRLRCSALLQTQPGAPGILIDCGPDFRAQMLALDSPELCCALLTHTHYDHVGGVDDLRPYAFAAPHNHFPLFCREDVARDLRERVPYCFTAHPYPGVPQFTLHLLEAFKPFTVHVGEGFDDVEVLPLPIMHGRLPIFGYRIGKFAYITDALHIPAETIEALRGLDVLVINALRIKEHPSHQNLKQALDVIKETAPRRAYLTHLSHDMGLQAEVEPTLPQGVHIAYDGLSISVADS